MKGGGKKQEAMKTSILVLVVLLLGTSDTFGQLPTCSEPPCGPAQFLGNDAQGTARIRCTARNPYTCVRDAAFARISDIPKNKPGSFETLDDKGMPNARYTYDAFIGTEQKDGMVELIFKNLKQQ